MKKLIGMLLSSLIILVGCSDSGKDKEEKQVTIENKGESNIVIKEGEQAIVYLEVGAMTLASFSTPTRLNKSDIEYVNPRASSNSILPEVKSIRFVKTKGPDFDSDGVVVPWSEFGKYGIKFTGPDTKGAPAVVYEYKVTLVTGRGDTDESFKKITVTAVNDPPQIVLPERVQAVPDEMVVLPGSAATDVDGQVVSYRWTQLSGLAVELEDPNAADLRFSAPAAKKVEDLEFQLTIKDNSGAVASKKITVSVVPADLPVVRIRYPSPTGVAHGKTISVSGYATAQGDEKTEKVEIHIGSTSYLAEITGERFWSVNEVPIPTQGDSFEILVIAEDSLGRIGSAKSKIKKSGSIVSDVKWSNIIGLHLDAWTGDILALTESGTVGKTISLMSIKPNSEKDDRVIYSFESKMSNTQSQGNVSTAFHFSDGKFYVGFNDSFSSPGVRLYSIDLTEGNREQLYPSDASGEVELESISGMVVDGEGAMVLADGITGNIYRVDGETRAFSSFGKDLFPVGEVNYLALAFDPFSTLYSLYIVPNYNDMPFYGVSVGAAEFEKAAGPFVDGKSPAKRVIVSESLATAFVLDFDGDVYMVDMENSQRMLYAEGPVGEIAYDVLDEILYLYYTDTKSIVMVDIFTGDLVEVTSSK
jgi:hypothetical protein